MSEDDNKIVPIRPPSGIFITPPESADSQRAEVLEALEIMRTEYHLRMRMNNDLLKLNIITAEDIKKESTTLLKVINVLQKFI